MRSWSQYLGELDRTHAYVLIAIGIVVPAASHLLGSGALAYGMYAHAPEYRVDLFAIDPGEPRPRHRLAPSELARGVKPSLVSVLLGSDHWRTTPRISDLRSTLPELAQRACRTPMAAGAGSVEIVLEEREREGAPVRSTRVSASCPP
jgi:hypothetical protein